MNVSTATIKFSRQEIEILINTLEFILSTNLPIDKDFLKPYEVIRKDLTIIKNQLISGEEKSNGKMTEKEFYGDRCETCE